MAVFDTHHPWVFSCGVLGNLISFMVYLAPVPTFYRVYKKKSTEGFQSIPYVVALFSSMLWIYYALLKSDAFLLITINSAGCAIETIYIVMYVVYAPKKATIFTTKLVLLLNVGLFCFILLLTQLLAKGTRRIKVLGCIRVACSVSVYAAPLSIMRRVIRTKSVEFIPFSLSFMLTLSAVIWFLYGLLMKDYYIALPNVLGFIFGVLQMILYAIYMNTKKVADEQNLPDHVADLNNIAEDGEEHQINALENYQVADINRDQKSRDRVLSSGNRTIESAKCEV